MEVEIKDFIGVFRGVFDQAFCKEMIKVFENASEAGLTQSRAKTEKGIPDVYKKDDQLFLPESLPLMGFGSLFPIIPRKLWEEVYSAYAEEYGILKNLADHRSYYIKVQKTKPSGGYHIWHCEADSREYAHRILAWIVYLNDVEEGGETEFLYQGKRVKAEAGTVVMWPSSFTHAHRGNPPISGDKYIATGWIEF